MSGRSRSLRKRLDLITLKLLSTLKISRYCSINLDLLPKPKPFVRSSISRNKISDDRYHPATYRAERVTPEQSGGQHVVDQMNHTVEITPIQPDHIASFHRALDFVARERRYLAF